jgi:hypothetical protein
MDLLAITGSYPYQLQLCVNDNEYCIMDNNYTKRSISVSTAEHLFRSHSLLHTMRRGRKFENKGLEDGAFARLHRKMVYLFNELDTEVLCDTCIMQDLCKSPEKPIFMDMNAELEPYELCAQYTSTDVECQCDVCMSQYGS